MRHVGYKTEGGAHSQVSPREWASPSVLHLTCLTCLIRGLALAMEKAQPVKLSRAVESSCFLKEKIKMICNLSPSIMQQRRAENHIAEPGTGLALKEVIVK